MRIVCILDAELTYSTAARKGWFLKPTCSTMLWGPRRDGLAACLNLRSQSLTTATNDWLGQPLPR